MRLTKRAQRFLSVSFDGTRGLIGQVVSVNADSTRRAIVRVLQAVPRPASSTSRGDSNFGTITSRGSQGGGVDALLEDDGVEVVVTETAHQVEQAGWLRPMRRRTEL